MSYAEWTTRAETLEALTMEYLTRRNSPDDPCATPTDGDSYDDVQDEED
jgi:hypothetical protein